MPSRSLAAIFGKLDRDENIGWLAGRPEAQVALARALGTSREVIRLALTPKRSTTLARWVTWDALPYARVLDLLEEPLFPGIPEAVLRPGAWELLVWAAPSGGGRSIVGRWLEARGLATSITAARWADATLPASRPLFVELGSGDGLELAAVTPGVCIAVPEPFRAPDALDGATVLRSPALSDVLEALVAWCRARLSSRTGLDPLRLVRWLRNGPLADGVVRSVGDVLGVAGLADTLGMEALESRPLARVAHEWVRQRAAERLDPDGPSTPWVRRAGFEGTVAIARRFVTDASEPAFFPRTSEEWSALLPAELKYGPDLDWLRAALPGADPALLRSDVERAVTKLPPGSFRLLRTFETLGLLERLPDDRLALRPHWLVRVAESVALDELLQGSPLDWGEALLCASAPTVATRLLARTSAGKLASDELLEPMAEGPPAQAAALEAAFRVAGLGALLGAELGPELLEGLWDEQRRLLFELPGALPVPRIEYTTLDASERGAWMLGRGAWYLAALAVSELIDARAGRSHPLLRPWQANGAPPGLAALLDAVREALNRPEAPRALLGATAALVGRLRGVLGPLGAGGTQHALERAAVVVEEVALGVLAWSSLAALSNDVVATAGVRHLIESRKLEEAFARSVWQAYRDAGSPLDGVGALLSPELAPLVWPAAPDDAVQRLLPALLAGDEVLVLGAERCRALLERDPEGVPLALFERLPEAVLEAAITAAARAGRDDAMRALWRRFPKPLAHAAGACLAAPNEPSTMRLAALLSSAPLDVTASLVEALDDVEALLRGPGETLGAVRGLLHTRLGVRGAGWREAYALFDAIERRYAPGTKGSLAPARNAGS